jgi:hypothetical protein
VKINPRQRHLFPSSRTTSSALPRCAGSLRACSVLSTWFTDEIAVASEAARSGGQPEIANVLSLSVGNRLWGQLRLLTGIIERLGGRTDLSEESESTQEAASAGERKP